MSRSGSKLNKQIANENREIIEECRKLVQKIVQKGEINEENLMLALCIRLKIPFNMTDFSKYDKKLLEKCIKELKYML